MYSFAGGGLPRTPDDGDRAVRQQTTSPDVPKELYDQMHAELQSALACAMPRASEQMRWRMETIVSYDADIP